MTWLRIDGYAATEIAAHTPVTWETWADGGSGSASWAFALSMTSQHQALRPGALVEVMCGPLPVWSGLLSDPDRTSWECTAYGFAADAQNWLALDGTGTPTRDIEVAIDNAIARGWRVRNFFSLSGVAAGDPTGNPISVAQLLTEYAEELGQRWGVDGERRVFLRSDPTQSSWLASPGAAAFGSTSEGRADRLFGRYLDSTTSLYQTASAGSGAESPVDLSARGAISSAEAVTILEGMLTRDHSGPAWTNGVTLTRDQLQTRGGSSAFLPAVVAGESMKALGLSNATQPFALAAVIGKTRYTQGSRVIYVEPVNTAPRNFVDVIAAA